MEKYPIDTSKPEQNITVYRKSNNKTTLLYAS